MEERKNNKRRRVEQVSSLSQNEINLTKPQQKGLKKALLKYGHNVSDATRHGTLFRGLVMAAYAKTRCWHSDPQIRPLPLVWSRLNKQEMEEWWSQILAPRITTRLDMAQRFVDKGPDYNNCVEALLGYDSWHDVEDPYLKEFWEPRGGRGTFAHDWRNMLMRFGSVKPRPTVYEDFINAFEYYEEPETRWDHEAESDLETSEDSSRSGSGGSGDASLHLDKDRPLGYGDENEREEENDSGKQRKNFPSEEKREQAGFGTLLKKKDGSTLQQGPESPDDPENEEIRAILRANEQEEKNRKKGGGSGSNSPASSSSSESIRGKLSVVRRREEEQRAEKERMEKFSKFARNTKEKKRGKYSPFGDCGGNIDGKDRDQEDADKTDPDSEDDDGNDYDGDDNDDEDNVEKYGIEKTGPRDQEHRRRSFFSPSPESPESTAPSYTPSIRKPEKGVPIGTENDLSKIKKRNDESDQNLMADDPPPPPPPNKKNAVKKEKKFVVTGSDSDSTKESYGESHGGSHQIGNMGSNVQTKKTKKTKNPKKTKKIIKTIKKFPERQIPERRKNGQARTAEDISSPVPQFLLSDEEVEIEVTDEDEAQAPGQLLLQQEREHADSAESSVDRGLMLARQEIDEAMGEGSGSGRTPSYTPSPPPNKYSVKQLQAELEGLRSEYLAKTEDLQRVLYHSIRKAKGLSSWGDKRKVKETVLSYLQNVNVDPAELAGTLTRLRVEPPSVRKEIAAMARETQRLGAVRTALAAHAEMVHEILWGSTERGLALVFDTMIAGLPGLVDSLGSSISQRAGSREQVNESLVEFLYAGILAALEGATRSSFETLMEAFGVKQVDLELAALVKTAGSAAPAETLSKPGSGDNHKLATLGAIALKPSMMIGDDAANRVSMVKGAYARGSKTDDMIGLANNPKKRRRRGSSLSPHTNRDVVFSF